MSTPTAFVRQLLQSAPLSTALSLSSTRLEQWELNNLLPLLAQFSQLTELDLADNKISSVDGIAANLNKLQRLDISGNPAITAGCAASLAALPALRHLSLPLPNAEDARLCLLQLPQLQSLNGQNVGLGAKGTAPHTRVPSMQAPASPVVNAAAAPASSSAAPATVAPVAAAAPAAGSSAPAVPAVTRIVPVIVAPSGELLHAPEINLDGDDLEPVATLFDAIRNLVPEADLAPQITPVPQGVDPAAWAKRHADLRLDTFEAHINATVVGLNTRLSEAPFNASSILRHAAILEAKHELYASCAEGLMSHARVLQDPLASAFASLRASESNIRARTTELLAFLDQEFHHLAAERTQALEQVRQLLALTESNTAKHLAEKAALLHRLESGSDHSSVAQAKLEHRLNTERESFHKEKKNLVVLIESLDQEVAQLRGGTATNSMAMQQHYEAQAAAAAREAAQQAQALQAALAAAQEHERSLKANMASREQYWLEREQAWEARMAAAQAAAGAAPQVIYMPAPQPAQPPQQQPQQQQQQANQVPAQRSTPPRPANQGLGSGADGSPAQQQAAQGSPQTFYPQLTGTQVSLTDFNASLAATSPAASRRAPFTSTNAPLSTPPVPQGVYSSLSGSQALTHNGGAEPHRQHQRAPSQQQQQGRSMTLKQIKDLIEEIYTSYDLLTKSWVASHNLREESTKETLLQHMYTFLNHKFGLKSLILDAANSLLKGLGQHGADHTVAVFAGILRHQLDYDFRYVEARTRKSVRELLKVYLTHKHPLKRDHALQAMVVERTRGSLTEEEYTSLVEYMFAPADRTPILSTIRTILLGMKQKEIERAGAAAITAGSRAQAMAASQALQAAQSSATGARLPINYTTFVHILLDFQLHIHRRFLAPFVALFQSFDALHSGLLTHDTFARLVVVLTEDQVDDATIRLYLKRADPFGHGLVSFSDAVNVLGEELKALALRTHRGAQPKDPREQLRELREMQQGIDAMHGGQPEQQYEEDEYASPELQPIYGAAPTQQQQQQQQQDYEQHQQQQQSYDQQQSQPQQQAPSDPDAEADAAQQAAAAALRQAFQVHGE